MGENHIIAKFCWTDLVIYSHSTERKTPSFSQRNTVAKCLSFSVKVLCDEQGADWQAVLCRDRSCF